MPPIDLSRVRIVLVEPRYGGNIGQCARAMLNMGFSRLVLVAPLEHLNAESYWMARDAKGILEGAEVHSTLSEALGSITLAVGTTRRVGKYRRPVQTPRQAARELLPLAGTNEIALVFGREDSGLTSEELDRCQWIVNIPASPNFPSLNLAQAVLVCCYEIFLASLDVSEGPGAAASPAGPDEPARGQLAGPERLDRFYTHLEEVLCEIHFLIGDQAPTILRTLKRIFGRANLEPRDLKILHGVLAQMDWYRSRVEVVEAGAGAAARSQTAAEVRCDVEMASEEDWPKILALLDACGLPSAGLEAHRDNLFVARKDGAVIGCVAMEPYEEGSILRSLAVAEPARRAGLGRKLVAYALVQARRRGAPAVYLLTSTAEEFFARLGFERVAREELPRSLRTSAEWSTEVCPTTAAVMRLLL